MSESSSSSGTIATHQSTSSPRAAKGGADGQWDLFFNPVDITRPSTNHKGHLRDFALPYSKEDDVFQLEVEGGHTAGWMQWVQILAFLQSLGKYNRKYTINVQSKNHIKEWDGQLKKVNDAKNLTFLWLVQEMVGTEEKKELPTSGSEEGELNPQPHKKSRSKISIKGKSIEEGNRLDFKGRAAINSTAKVKVPAGPFSFTFDHSKNLHPVSNPSIASACPKIGMEGGEKDEPVTAVNKDEDDVPFTLLPKKIKDRLKELNELYDDNEEHCEDTTSDSTTLDTTEQSKVLDPIQKEENRYPGSLLKGLEKKSNFFAELDEDEYDVLQPIDISRRTSKEEEALTGSSRSLLSKAQVGVLEEVMSLSQGEKELVGSEKKEMDDLKDMLEGIRRKVDLLEILDKVKEDSTADKALKNSVTAISAVKDLPSNSPTKGMNGNRNTVSNDLTTTTTLKPEVSITAIAAVANNISTILGTKDSDRSEPSSSVTAISDVANLPPPNNLSEEMTPCPIIHVPGVTSPSKYGLNADIVDVSPCPSPVLAICPPKPLVPSLYSDRRERVVIALESSSNTPASRELLQILVTEEIDPESNLWSRLFNLAKSLQEGGDSASTMKPETQTGADTLEKMLSKVLDKINDHSEMLNAIAEASGVNLLDNDESGPETKKEKGKTKEQPAIVEDNKPSDIPLATRLCQQVETSDSEDEEDNITERQCQKNRQPASRNPVHQSSQTMPNPFQERPRFGQSYHPYYRSPSHGGRPFRSPFDMAYGPGPFGFASYAHAQASPFFPHRMNHPGYAPIPYGPPHPRHHHHEGGNFGHQWHHPPNREQARPSLDRSNREANSGSPLDHAADSWW